MKYDQKFRAMKFLLGVKIGFKNSFFFFFLESACNTGDQV